MIKLGGSRFRKEGNSPSRCDGEPVGSTAAGGCQLRYHDWIILGEITTLKAVLNKCEGKFRASGPGKQRKETASLFLYGVVQLGRCTCSPLKHAGWAAACTAVGLCDAGRDSWAKWT